MSTTHQNHDSSIATRTCPECDGRVRGDDKTNDRYCKDCGLVVDERLDRDVTSASPFRSRAVDVLPREIDESRGEQRDLETTNSAKTGERSGRPLGTQIAKRDIDSKRWERLRKRDESVLTFDPERYEREGDEYLKRHDGAGVETDGDDRIRSMSLLGAVDALASTVDATRRTRERARSLVLELPADETNGRQYEAVALGALVVAHDEHIAERIRRIDAHTDEIQQIQNALERAQSPAKRFRVLENLTAVANDDRVQRLVANRLAEREAVEAVAERRGFEVATVVAGVTWE
ncbi:hypothetical protein [Halopiger thermotolerans]